MLQISDPLTSTTLRDYHREELTNPARAYYTEGSQLQGFWHGRLADDHGLTGNLKDEQFDRVIDGKDPITGDQIIRYRSGKAVEDGREMEHRGGFDFVFSAPKSVSVTAFVGGDERILAFHRAAVKEAADYGEQFMQAHLGGRRGDETTGKWIAAGFEHSTSRPVDGYAAPQLHTHLVVMNMTAHGKDAPAHAIEPDEMFKLQTAMSRVYQNRLAYELLNAGYDIEQGKNHAPEIKGYTTEYLQAQSERVRLINEQMAAEGRTGRKSALIIAQQTKEDKLDLTAEEIYAKWRENGAQFGQPADRVVEFARQRERTGRLPYESPERAVTWAIQRLAERESVIELHGYKHVGGIVQNALEYSQGRVKLGDVLAEAERRKHLTADDRAKGITTPELVVVHHHRDHAPGERYAPRESIANEREMIEHVLSRRDKYVPIANEITREEFRQANRGNLTNKQMWMVWESLKTPDQVTLVNGSAGAGKSWAMRTFATIGRDHGYVVKGLTPTSSSRKELDANGIESITLAKHLASRSGSKRPDQNEAGKHRLYVVDEASLVNTKDFHRFLRGLKPTDRVLVIGDTGQHASIEAGSPFAQLQAAGAQVIKLDKIMRQRENPDLLRAVELVQHGHVKASIAQLDKMGVIVEQPNVSRRFEEIAKLFAISPDDSMVLSPDNKSRAEINQAVRKELLANGDLGDGEYAGKKLLGRNDMYQRDTHLASKYEVGNFVKAGIDLKEKQIKAGEFLEVLAVDSGSNTLTVKRQNGKVFGYNPERDQMAASVHRTEDFQVRVGERVQLTSQWKEKGLANREVGVIESIDQDGNAKMRMAAKEGQNGRRIEFNVKDFPHLDYAYSMTSYSSQSMTIRNVMAHVDTGDTRARSLLDRISAYVMWSRASHNLHIFTDRKIDLVKSLDRLEERPMALSIEQTEAYKQYMPRERELPQRSIA